MAGLFSLAAQKARQMAEGKPDPITIDAGPFKVKIPMADGGLSSIQKNISIKGQPHELSYITPGEGDLLKDLGGSGRMVNGIPAYDFPDYKGEFDSSEDSYFGGGLGWNTSNIPSIEDEDTTENLVRRANLLKGEDGEEEDKNLPPGTIMSRYGPITTKFGFATQGTEALTDEELGTPPLPLDRPKEGLGYDPSLYALQKQTLTGNLNTDVINNWNKTLPSAYESMNRTERLDYSNMLQRYGLPAFGTGLLGRHEVRTPMPVTGQAHKEWYKLQQGNGFHSLNYGEDEVMAQDEYERDLSAEDIRIRFDAAKEGQTLSDVLKGTTLTPEKLGMPPNINAKAVGDFMNVNALEGILSGGLSLAAGIANPGVGFLVTFSDLLVGEGLRDDWKKFTRAVQDETGLPLEEARKLSAELESKYEEAIPSDKTIAKWIAKNIFGWQTENYPWFNLEKRSGGLVGYKPQTEYKRETGGKVTPPPPIIIDPPTPKPIPPDPEPAPEDTRPPMQKYYNIDPEEDEWYKDEDRKPMEEYYKDFPLDVNPNFTANQLRILAYSYPELFGNYEPPPKPPKDPEPPIDLPIYRRSRGIM